MRDLVAHFRSMNNTQLKQYISQHRNDDEEFSQALAILISRRDPNATRYSGNMTLEEIEKVIKDKLDRAS